MRGVCILLLSIFCLTAHAQLNEHVINANYRQFIQYIKRYCDAIIIDVRTEQAYDDSGFKGAVFIPTSKKLEIFADTINLQTPLLVYCNEGSRSITACNLLFDLGFVHIINLKSGIEHKKKEIQKFNNQTP